MPRPSLVGDVPGGLVVMVGGAKDLTPPPSCPAATGVPPPPIAPGTRLLVEEVVGIVAVVVVTTRGPGTEVLFVAFAGLLFAGADAGFVPGSGLASSALLQDAQAAQVASAAARKTSRSIFMSPLLAIRQSVRRNGP